MAVFPKSLVAVSAFWVVFFVSFALGQSSSTLTLSSSSSPSDAPGTISGTVVDQSGAVVAGAEVKLTYVDSKSNAQALSAISDKDGEFFFPRVDPGAFQLAITSTGFEAKAYSGTLRAAEVQTVPPIAMTVAEAHTEVQVGLSRVEVATEEIKEEEHQRVLGVIPNFYVSYVSNAAPLDAKQKFQLAFRSMLDPFNILIVGGSAGVEQAQNHFAQYGQGALGYGKRFGANYADIASGTLIGGAILPSLLKQDPRYFYKGTGTIPARASYAMASALICKGDNGRWQPNYSNVAGNLAAGGLSNLYYPEQDRNGAALTFENGAVAIAASAIQNLFQEFIVKKLTPKRKGQGGP